MSEEIEPKRGRGRPPADVNMKEFEKLAKIHCTYEEIAAWFGLSRRTIVEKMKDPEFRLAYETGKLKGKVSLRRLQWRHARGEGNGAVNMTKHLSEHHLGETAKPSPVTMIQNNNTLALLTNASESDLLALESILARIADTPASQGRIGEEDSDSAEPAG